MSDYTKELGTIDGEQALEIVINPVRLHKMHTNWTIYKKGIRVIVKGDEWTGAGRPNELAGTPELIDRNDWRKLNTFDGLGASWIPVVELVRQVVGKNPLSITATKCTCTFELGQWGCTCGFFEIEKQAKRIAEQVANATVEQRPADDDVPF